MEKVVEISDKTYPELLKQIKGAPKKLYYKGEWPSCSAGKNSIFENCLAVVGSRRLTSYGRKMTEILVSEIAVAGVTIVSGFMYGGDEAAHKAAVEVGGRTIAVMPCGIDLIHPAYQKDLYQEILNNHGLIVSEFPGKTSPLNWMYATRNRIVAGLSKAVLIVEAGLDSGTMITANYAKKFNRKIFAVPGPLTSDVSKGTAKLIKEGAAIATEAVDVLKYFNFKLVRSPASHKKDFAPGSGLERKIIDFLKTEPLTPDDLARNIGTPVSKVSVSLSLMQLRGLVKQEGDKYYLS